MPPADSELNDYQVQVPGAGADSSNSSEIYPPYCKSSQLTAYEVNNDLESTMLFFRS